MNDITSIIILVVLILSSAFFSGSETALTSFKRMKLKEVEKENPRVAKYLRLWLKKPNEIIATILVGNTIVNIFASSIATVLTVKIIREMSGNMSESFAIIIASVIMTILLLIFSEITPKVIARSYSEKLSKAVILPIYYISYIIYPIVIVFTTIAVIFSRIIGLKVNKEAAMITEEDIRSIVSVGEEEGVIEAEEKKMIHSIFDFSDTTVREVMVPRTSVFALEASRTLEEVWDKILETGYSRIPVYDVKIDSIIGIVYLKDLINVYQKGNTGLPLQNFMREAYFIPETKLLVELLREFREKKIHLAIALDEYGGTQGIVTIEDLLEEIVGEINDEFDDDDKKIVKLSQDTYSVNPLTNIDILNNEIKIAIPYSEDYDTLSGYVYYELGRVPIRGDRIEGSDFVIEVCEVDKNRVIKSKIIIK